MKIITNKAKCKKCGDIIESKYTHNFVTCKCGALSVDGGKDYLRRLGNIDDFEDMSEVVEKMKILSFKKLRHFAPRGSSGTGYSELDLFEIKFQVGDKEYISKITIDIWYRPAKMIKDIFTEAMQKEFGDVEYNFEEAFSMYLDEVAGKSCPYSKKDILKSVETVGG